MPSISIKDIAEHIGAEVQGDETLQISKIASLDLAQASQLTFALAGKNPDSISQNQAGAIIIAAEVAALCPKQTILLHKNPHLAFAKACELFKINQSIAPGIHPSAIIGDNCSIADSASIAANVVIGNNVVIEADCKIHANTVIGDNCVLGKNCELKTNISFTHDCILGNNGLIHEGTVIGSDGFGNTKDGEAWYKLPQLGTVIIGNNVEIGANSTIDRGALENTIIADGVRIDNLVHIAHNVEVGEHTAIAAQGVIAGGTKLGRHCMLSGNVGMTDHLTICDNAIFTGKAVVTNSVKIPGVYSSGTGLFSNRDWRRMVVHLRNLDKLMGPIKKLIKQSNNRGE
jgi:UDP-3-O-[3-hydroxymyristoyl] glucosamine N-acyltransferase